MPLSDRLFGKAKGTSFDVPKALRQSVLKAKATPLPEITPQVKSPVVDLPKQEFKLDKTLSQQLKPIADTAAQKRQAVQDKVKTFRKAELPGFGTLPVAPTFQDLQEAQQQGIRLRTPTPQEPEFEGFQKSFADFTADKQAFGAGVVKEISPFSKDVPVVGQALEAAEERKPFQFAAGEITGKGTELLAGYLAAGPLAAKLGVESKIANAMLKTPLARRLGAKTAGDISKFLATQGTALFLDTVAQSPFEVFEFVNNDKTASEDLKQFVDNRALDAAFNLAFGVSGKIAKSGINQIKKIAGEGGERITGLIKSKLNQVPAAQRQVIQEELGLAPEVTAQDFLKQQEQFAREFQLENYFKEFDRTPAQVLEDFNQWRRTNFGGAFGRVSPGDEQALKELYKETTGIDLDVALREAREMQRLLNPQETLSNKITQIEAVDMVPNRPGDFVPLRRPETLVPTPGQQPDFSVAREQVKKNTGKAKDLTDVIAKADQYQDVGVTERWTTDVFRQFEKVFGEDFGVVKRTLLDPFDQAKAMRVNDEIALTDALQSDIVEKLGIKNRSKESALVQQLGEGTITKDELFQMVGPEKGQKIVDADKWFREQYDKLLNEINQSRALVGKEVIPKLDNYYRHFNEMGDTFQGIKNVFESNRQIDPSLEGISEFTRPGEKWASFKQKRTGKGKFTEDAVGGFIDYIKAGTYAKHIDPQIPNFRNFRKELVNSVESVNSKNLNNFIGFLDEYANDLSGKTNKFDRSFQDLIGRKPMAIINLLNSRMKSNAVLGNASSALSQIANVPQAIAEVQNPQQLANGLKGYMQSILGGGDAELYKMSGFLKERLTDSFGKFDTRLIDQPKKFAGWALGALDEVGTKFIWSSVYRKGLSEGVQNPIKYADDITRKLVAGRGIGEVPTLQKSKLFQLVAPFTLEVGNLWKIQKDFLKRKDFKALLTLYTANFLLNRAMEQVRGSGVVFDPIQAIMDGVEGSEGLGDMLIKVPGSLAGETLGNVPTGQAVAQLLPEFGKTTDIEAPGFIKQVAPSLVTKDDTLRIPPREEIFGRADPTRFGTELPLVRAVQKPVSSFLLPFGGQQVRKSIQGAKTLGLVPEVEQSQLQMPDLPAARTASGRIITPVEPTPTSTAQGLLFGRGAIPEVRQAFEEEISPLGKEQTKNFEKLMQSGQFEANELFQAITKARKFKKKRDRIKVLRETFDDDKVIRILSTFFGYKL